jgi:hypothetical protein
MTPTPGTHFFLGLDLGQRHDFTALAILDRTVSLTGHTDPVTFQRETTTSLCFRHLHRYPAGTPYTTITAHLARLVSSPQLSGRSTLVLDATGIGSLAPSSPSPSPAVTTLPSSPAATASPSATSSSPCKSPSTPAPSPSPPNSPRPLPSSMSSPSSASASPPPATTPTPPPPALTTISSSPPPSLSGAPTAEPTPSASLTLSQACTRLHRQARKSIGAPRPNSCKQNFKHSR